MRIHLGGALAFPGILAAGAPSVPSQMTPTPSDPTVANRDPSALYRTQLT